MSEVAITLKNVAKYYKLYNKPKDRLKEALHPFKKRYHEPFYALKDINLEIKKGDILGVVGRNGCGKSTLLKLITGVLQPSEGTINVTGKITALLELGAGFNPEFTGIDNIQFYSKVLGVSDQELEEKLPLIIAFADLGAFLYQPVKTYSSGMKSRLGFSVAVHIDPEILILDEVLAVGDALFKRKCYAKMEEFFKAGKTIIYVSHDANSVNQLCNRAVLIHEGKIIMDAPPRDVTRYYGKLLFSKSDHIKKIVSEICSLPINGEEINTGKISSASMNAPHLDDPIPKSYFIPGMKSASASVLKNYDVEIGEPVIKSMSGQQVNVLVTGESYQYIYNVKFFIDSEEVSLGFNIKEEKGVIVSAAALHQANKCIPLVKNGETLEVTWHFECRLLPGRYYTTNGVSAIINEDRQFLTRAVDVCVFKVVNSSNCISNGLVDLSQKMSVKVLNKQVARDD